jgi:hypothetical protein
MRDFTLVIYKQLLQSAINAGYTLTSYEDYIINGHQYAKVFILRHDVDDLPNNSVQTAIIENTLGAKGSYYFRVVKKSFHPNCIEQIKKLNHEIGYHYEDMALNNGNYEKSYQHFTEKLNIFKTHYPVKTICMHGSPLSKWDNRLLWQKYNYKELGIIGEPYFDIDFSKILYITDTGRQWNNKTSSVRDKVKTNYQFTFKSTNDIIRSFNENKLPSVIMLNIHPQRWTDNVMLGMKQLVIQKLKNSIKKIIIKKIKNNFINRNYHVN